MDNNKKEHASVDEALDVAARRKRAILMKRLAPRIKIAREKAKRRIADLPRLKQRARKHARNLLFKKITKGKGRDEIGMARKKEIEKRLEKMKPRIDRIALKMLPQVRRMEKERKRPKSEKQE